MSFPSCIKIPGAKTNSALQTSTNNSTTRDNINYEELIGIANSVFGESRWSHAITSQTVDFVEYVMGKYHIGCAAFVRVQLADGTFHEDMGYSITESSIKGSAIKSARSLSITVALKKALLCFGGIIEEKISEKTGATKRFKQDSNTSEEEKIVEHPIRIPLILQENASKDIITVENIVHIADENLNAKKPPGKPRSPSTPTRNKSPNPTDANGGAPVINELELVIAEVDNAVNDPTNPGNNNGATIPTTPGSMTEDELRMERKRRQKQKQEEYKRLMKEKLWKGNEKSNPKF